MSRYWRRRATRHALIACSGFAVGMLVVVLLGEQGVPVFRLSMASAYASLALLGYSLAIGPFNVLRRRPNPVSSDVRRDVGIWAGVFAVAHVVFGLQVHLPGHMIQYFLWAPEDSRALPIRYDVAGVTNWAGLLSALILLLLLAISNDAALRRLGTRRWKAIQRWSYVAFGLMALHGVIYQVLENRSAAWMVAFGVVLAAVIIVQTIGVRRARSRNVSASS